MRKNLLLLILSIIGIIIFSIIYLSIYGIKTEKFNNFIIEKINQFDSKLSLKIEDVFLKLNIKEKSIKINTENAKIYVDKESINLANIDIHLDLIKFLKKENSINKIKISTEENNIKNVTNFLNIYRFNVPRFVFYNQIEDGNIKAIIDLNYNKDKKNFFTYEIVGKLSDAKLNIFNKIKFNNINFDFKINDNKYYFDNISFNNEGVDFYSEKILVEKLGKDYEVKGNLVSKKGLINPKYVSELLNFNLDYINKDKIIAETNNKFQFKLNSKKKIKNLNINSKINFKEIFINEKFQKLIFLKNGIIDANYTKNNLKIEIDSGYSFLNKNYKNNEKDKIKIKIIKEQNKDYEIEAFINNKENTVNSSELLNYIQIDKSIINDQDLNFDSNNHISFNLNEQSKIKNLKIISKLDLDKLLLKYKFSKLKKIFPNYNNIIKTKNNIINIDFSKNNLKIVADGNYSFDKKFDKFNFELSKNKKEISFNTEVEFKTEPIILKNINYKKEKDILSKIKFKGEYFDNKKIKFHNINFTENLNNFLLSNLYLSNKFKIIDLDKLQIKFFNNDGILNHLTVLKKNDIFELNSKNFDGRMFVSNLLTSDTNNSFLKRFDNLNSKFILNSEEFFITKIDYLNKINGNLLIENNKIKSGNIIAKLNGKNDFSLNIKTNSNNEKITNLFISKPEPFIKYYKFIKGFEEGSLSYDSVEKNGISKSKLKIYDFKVKEVPVLAKILTLASLQGIADILTGEGIRFDDLEMDYESSKKLTTINELYAIGPAISILLEGYIEKKKLTSLRGTLVPATTINKTISKIPLLGNILVGKKVGEGVFGVSFKIKGAPKNLKTTVNPIKTLTPRFITRTIEKIKRN